MEEILRTGIKEKENLGKKKISLKKKFKKIVKKNKRIYLIS